MPRLIPAARQLNDEVTDSGRQFKFTIGEPDGFGFVRRITYDPKTSRWLVPILEAIEDPRIRMVTYTGKGRAQITFVSDHRADFRDPFGVVAVAKVLHDDD